MRGANFSPVHDAISRYNNLPSCIDTPIKEERGDMAQWLDSLSEEWISQPRSSTPASRREGSSLIEYSSSRSQSRIPRLKARSTSYPGIRREDELEKGNSQTPSKNGSPLIEKTASALNAFSKLSLKQSINKNHPKARVLPAKLGRRHTSNNFSSSVQQGTIQCKIPRIAPTTNDGLPSTPEWKRRVLEGVGKPGEQRDLFSSIGLEQIFRPPSVRKDALQRKGRKYEPQAAAIFPSSPPPYPQATHPGPPVSSTSQTALTGGSQKGKVDSSKTIAIEPLIKPGGQIEVRQLSDEEDYSTDKSPNRNSRARKLKIIHSNYSPNLPIDQRDHRLTLIHGTNPEGGKLFSSETGKSKSSVRIISSSSELHNEAISPVSLPRINSMDAIRSRNRPSSRSSDNEIDYRNTESTQPSEPLTPALADCTSHSLPDDLSIGTEAFISNGVLVNKDQGRCSSNKSWQKRSPGFSSLPSSDAFSESSSQTSLVQSKTLRQFSPRETRSQLPNTSPLGLLVTPTTPRKANQKSLSSPIRPKASNSPLKIFDKYDTFTNERLVRRLSQLEESFHDDQDDSVREVSKGGTPTDIGLPDGIIESSTPIAKKISKKSDRRVSSFGDGGLDNYGFSHETPATKYLSYDADETFEDRADSLTPPKLHQSGKLHFERRPEFSSMTSKQTRKSSTSMKRQRTGDRDISKGADGRPGNCIKNKKDSLANENCRNPNPVDETEYEKPGKRFLHSPVKGSQPKRRRMTITTEDLAKDPSVHAVDFTKGNPIIGRKRKDARYEAHDQVADPKVLATRHILRPRTPTPSQIRLIGQHDTNENRNTSNAESLENVGEVESKKMADDDTRQTVDAPTHILAEELANFAIDVAQDVTTGARKTSVTTADFFNEANLIMQHIRANSRPQSMHTGDKMTKVEQLDGIEELIDEESTLDRFSRPPSREGGSLRRLREPKQIDPRVISHLQKYQDDEDLGIALSSSLRALQLLESDSQVVFSDVESDPPNIRLHVRQNSENQEEPVSSEVYNKMYSRHSYQSSRTSTERSNPTGSSSGSGNKAIIAPAKVSHLISDHVAGMTFDRTKQVWMKRKSSDNNISERPDGMDDDMTEDDPLGEIPDLSVDESEELVRVNSIALVSRPTSGHDPTYPQVESRDALPLYHVHHSLHSKVDHLQGRSESKRPADVIGEKLHGTENTENEEEVEREISILEDRCVRTPERAKTNHRQPRVVTVTFSSPLINHVQESFTPPELVDVWEEESILDLRQTPERPQPQKRQASAHMSYKQTPSANFRRGGRRLSLSSRVHLARPISRIDEEDELSFLPGPKNTESNMHLILSTPRPLHDFPGTMSAPPSTGRRSEATFHLSSLPEFTLHQVDDLADRDFSYVARRRGLLSAEDVEGRFSLAIKDLVKTITDVEPYEPYWEYIRKLDLRKKRLVTLHLLEDFCGRIEELNISDNELGQLNGAPSSVRVLIVGGNSLSNLTTWNHLQNLQYLDVSRNNIQTLQGLQSLRHLRGLRADDNRIESLDGICELDGLMKLRLRRNLIKSIGFEGTNL